MQLVQIPQTPKCTRACGTSKLRILEIYLENKDYAEVGEFKKRYLSQHFYKDQRQKCCILLFMCYLDMATAVVLLIKEISIGNPSTFWRFRV